jgi:hypothetical protein
MHLFQEAIAHRFVPYQEGLMGGNQCLFPKSSFQSEAQFVSFWGKGIYSTNDRFAAYLQWTLCLGFRGKHYPVSSAAVVFSDLVAFSQLRGDLSALSLAFSKNLN